MTTISEFFRAPLEGKLSVSKVFVVYGLLGSLVYGCLEFFINPLNSFVMRLYTLGGCFYSGYVIVGTYQCAVNCKTAGMARFVRVSCVISLALLPLLTYAELSGVLDSEMSQLDQLNF
jgi:surface polysaccharide O-acyltransferase-like enzyme